MRATEGYPGPCRATPSRSFDSRRLHQFSPVSVATSIDLTKTCTKRKTIDWTLRQRRWLSVTAQADGQRDARTGSHMDRTVLDRLHPIGAGQQLHAALAFVEGDAGLKARDDEDRSLRGAI